VIQATKDRHQWCCDFSQCRVGWIGTLKDSLTPSGYIYVKQFWRKEINNNLKNW